MDEPTPTRARILLVEDQPETGEVLDAALQTAGYAVEWATSLQAARRLLLAQDFDLLVTDVRLPDGSGLDLCYEVTTTSDTPVIVVSSADTARDRIAGFEAGADDYVVKPFHLFELRKRIEAVLRRAAPQRRDGVDDVRGLTLHVASGQIEYQGQRARLTRSEVGILQVLMGQPGRTHSAAELSGRVWGYEQLPDANFVQQHVSRLRRKLATLGAEGVIETVYGVGYTIATTPSDDPPPPASRPDAPSEG
ncbi:MAG: response regulator transcription factor [Dehalococcoidia bacterium]|nr:response regulator transcription factor [Dehalococcoidia bacterium]